jgi:preprotein translocase subunit SecF
MADAMATIMSVGVVVGVVVSIAFSLLLLRYFGGKKGRASLQPKITPFVDCANTANCASGHACP